VRPCSAFRPRHVLGVRERPIRRAMSACVVELIAGLIFGLACIGFGVFQLVAPRRIARFNVPYNRWWYERIPWFYSLPTMKKHLDEDAEARASRRVLWTGVHRIGYRLCGSRRHGRRLWDVSLGERPAWPADSDARRSRAPSIRRTRQGTASSIRRRLRHHGA
jgi:hypothetical protein